MKRNIRSLSEKADKGRVELEFLEGLIKNFTYDPYDNMTYKKDKQGKNQLRQY